VKGIPTYVVEASQETNVLAAHAAGLSEQCWCHMHRAMLVARDDGYVRAIRANKLAEARVLARATFHFIGMFKEFES
jgi:hypothetical protein